ncbi:putative PGAP1 like protein Alpha beta hydrolase family [Trypanosoma vivax]|uniref:GPI inositol-deacylase n=1 Tax=Trypanosoma vivax (strain Y486) TaxID=1055687 RepID=G0TSS5_TRYVY|nr:putative PGAP1 like protein Alpha beta hydrolase family [Trypanosoma vivax]KAH8612855.1 putative PGAP1 like protein Alpha beta hydrolase family [Trypanosoma vivax]CCC47003.1 conserved hypothetical protein [Trypanosoma vivax Y486]
MWWRPCRNGHDGTEGDEMESRPGSVFEGSVVCDSQLLAGAELEPVAATAATPKGDPTSHFSVRLCICAALLIPLMYCISMVIFALQVNAFARNHSLEPLRRGTHYLYLDFKAVFSNRASGSEAQGREGAYTLYRAAPPSLGTTQRETYASPNAAVYFVHGNSGSYRQVYQLALALTQQKEVVSEIYTFDFVYQANIHRGRLLKRQALFALEAIEAVEGARHDVMWHSAPHKPAPCIWVVGHSMGGVVVHLVSQALARTELASRVAGVVTLNAPHRYPPIFLDGPMQREYFALWSVRPRNSGPRNSTCGSHPMLSITSGTLDMLVEQQLTQLPPSECSTEAHVNVRTEDPAVCGKTLQHNDILRDGCVVAFVTSVIANNTLRGTSSSERPAVALPSMRTLNDTTAAATPVPRLTFNTFSQWAQKTITGKLLTASAASLYAALVLCATHSLFLTLLREVGSLFGSGALLAHCCSNRGRYSSLCESLCYRCVCFSLMENKVVSVMLGTLFMGLTGWLLLVQLLCCVFPTTGWCSMPWVSDTLVCTPSANWLSLPVRLLLATGPVLLGAWAGVITYSLLWVLLWLSCRLSAGCRSMSHRLMRARNLPLLSHKAHSRPEALLCQYTPLALYCISLFLFALVFPLQPCNRALTWFGLAVLLLPLSNVHQANSLDVADKQQMDTHMCVIVYAFLNLLHLSPFFVWRNMWLSATSDDDSMLDSGSHVVEVLLNILLFAATSQLLYKSTRTEASSPVGERSDHPRVGFSCARTVKLIIASLCLIFVWLSTLMLCAVPVETFRVVTVMVFLAPCVLWELCSQPHTRESVFISNDAQV